MWLCPSFSGGRTQTPQKFCECSKLTLSADFFSRSVMESGGRGRALTRTANAAQVSALGTTVWQTTRYMSVAVPEDLLAERGSCSVVCLGLDQIPGLGDERQTSCAHDFKPYCLLEPMLCRWYSCGSQFHLQFPPGVQSVPRIFYISGTTGQRFQMLHIRTEMAPALQAAASLGAAGSSWHGSGCWVKRSSVLQVFQ